MSDMINRLLKVQASAPREEAAEIPDMPLSALKQERMTFGKTHVGRTFEEIWTGHPEWIKWFFQHYQFSSKAEHRLMIMFITKMVEELEQNPVTDQQAPVLPKSFARPKVMPMQAKAKAAPAPSVAAGPETMNEAEIPWPASQDRAMIHGLEARVLNMENALQQILHHLSPPQTVHPAPVSMATPMNHQVPEWDDPWHPLEEN